MYNQEETLLIELPLNRSTPASFNALSDVNRKNRIKHLIIVQEYYDDYSLYPDRSSFVTIPDTIANLSEVERITIKARIETLPKTLCSLNKLKLLNLSGCYYILSIPSEVLAMPNLKIKIGAVLSPASEVIVIGVPRRQINMDIFSLLSDGNNRKISQLIVHQVPQERYSDPDDREVIVIPDDICTFEGIRNVRIRGNILKIPDWIFQQKSLETLGLCGHFDTIPAILGELKELSTLDLSGCYSLMSLPSSIGSLSKLRSLRLYGCLNLASLPDAIGNLPKLTSLVLGNCAHVESLPESLGNLHELVTLDLSSCQSLGSLPESIGNLTKLTSLVLSGCSDLRSLPASIGNLSKLTSLGMSECDSVVSLPESIQNLSQLTSLNLSLCQNLVSLPENIGRLSELTSLHVRWCENLVSLPSSIGQLSKLTSLDIYGCQKLVSLPRSIRHLTRLTHPLWFCGCIEMPLNMEWKDFNEGIGLIGYLRYMVKMKRYGSFVSGLSYYLQRMYVDSRFDDAGDQRKKRVGELFEICGREEDGGIDMIKMLCRWLSERVIENCEGSVDLLEQKLSGDDIRDCGVECLSLLYENTCGMEVKQTDIERVKSTGRGMKEIWMNTGKDEEEKKEWKRRWREIGDVMREEDVVDMLNMMLCIPEDERNDKGVIQPGDSSMWAIFGLGAGVIEGCHFDISDEDDEDGNCVIIRNLPAGYDASDDVLLGIIGSYGVKTKKVRQARSRWKRGNICSFVLPVVTVVTETDEDAIVVEKAMNGQEFNGRDLIVKRKRAEYKL